MMRFTVDDLQALCEHLVRRERPAVLPDPAAILAAYAEAAALADGRPENEPAALFVALARRSRALGSIARSAVPASAHAAAINNGMDLMRGDAELAIDRLRVLRQAIAWEELLRTFAERLQPIGAPEIPPPKRRP